MPYTDTHSHIYAPEFNDDFVSMFERALKDGVDKILMPAIDSSCHEAMLKIEQDYPEICFSMMGLHPCYVKENYADELKIAKEYLDKRPFKAVGEIGLDFYWDKTFTDQQYKAFHEQIEWALHFDLPIVIHSRNSTDECIQVVTEHQQGKLKGVFHCFSGNTLQAKQVIDMGFYLGIGGVLTFKNSGLDKVVAESDINNIVLETDAPYLAPVPFRGKRNESSYIKYVAQKIAEIKKITIDEVGEITTKNAEKLFGK
jgi:TatD DNase family protein